LPGGVKSRNLLVMRQVMTKQLLVFLAAVWVVQGAPSAAALSAFDAYTAQVEARLATPYQPPTRGETVIEQIQSAAVGNISGAMLHHWRGTAFARGAHASDFERILRNFSAYPEYFAPEVTQAAVISAAGDRVSAEMRVRQKHVVTVEMDLTCDVTFAASTNCGAIAFRAAHELRS
jgi:hypothetical protein